ncbi:M56 family metallopeptidase [Chamaesiphon sp.]|uniref:M56 family metallopeptidase n=1 Tax=Chamaesiphon sp. TaxID=2814140 RepID=UPI003593B38F
MHLVVLFTIFALAWGLRYTWSATAAVTWNERWERSLTIFVLPPLLLFTSAIAIIWMGPHGRMVWIGNDWVSYDMAIGCLGFATLYWLKLAHSGWLLLQQVRTYPTTELGGKRVRLLELPMLYSAQIGFWEPELVITQVLLDTLDTEHLAAVLAHEQAHYHYRDTYYFFWLGWVRQLTKWLPQTEAIWQELLALRELRADRWASDLTDPLLVAEALLLVVQNTPAFTDVCAAFSQMAPADRLDRRIEALLAISTPQLAAPDGHHRPQYLSAWIWLLLALLPLLAVPFHS